MGETEDRLLTTKEAAELVKMSVSWLEKRRFYGDGPPYIKLDRAVRYRYSELRSWFEQYLVVADPKDEK